MPAPKGIDHERVVAAYRTGLPPLEIAERFGVRPTSIQYVLRKHGLNMRPPRRAYGDTVAEIIANGGTFEQAARELKSPLKNVLRSWNTICRKLGEHP